LDSKENNFFDILLDIWVGLGSEMKFKSRDLDFNEFPISERFKPFVNRKFWSLAKGFKIQTNGFKPRSF
jgi:hypothetical protein